MGRAATKAPDKLAAYQKELGVDGLDRLAKATEEFTIGQVDEAEAFNAIKGMWGCCGAWRNVCEKGVGARPGRLHLFLHLRAALNKWVDSLPRKSIPASDIVVCLSSEPSDGPILRTYLLLCSAMFNPKVQTYLRCGSPDPEYEVNDHGFATSQPEAPEWKLDLLTAPCRLCKGCAAPADKSVGLLFETSDEVVARLLERPSWNLVQLEYTMDIESKSLMRMLVKGELGGRVQLRIDANRKVSDQDAFFRFASMSKGSAVQQGVDASSVAPLCDVEDHDMAGGTGGAGAQEGDDHEARELFQEYLGEMMDDFVMVADGLAADSRIDDIVQDYLGDQDDKEEGNDAADLGADEPVGEEPDEGGPGGENSGPDEVDGPVEPVVRDIERVAEAFHPEGPSGHEPPPPLPAPEGPGWEISDLGYVTTSQPPFAPNTTVGLVGYKADGSSIFANCHSHPKCSVSAGIRVRDVPREYMARWLMLGIPIDRKAPLEARLAAGRRHRDLWVKPLM